MPLLLLGVEEATVLPLLSLRLDKAVEEGTVLSLLLLGLSDDVSLERYVKDIFVPATAAGKQSPNTFEWLLGSASVHVDKDIRGSATS